MGKTVLALLMALVIGLSFVGCQKKAETPEAMPPAEETMAPPAAEAPPAEAMPPAPAEEMAPAPEAPPAEGTAAPMEEAAPAEPAGSGTAQ